MIDMTAANDMIAAAHAEDVQKARLLVRAAIAEAGDAWLPSAAVFDALTLELIELAGRTESPARVAEHLTEIAALLTRAQKQSH